MKNWLVLVVYAALCLGCSGPSGNNGGGPGNPSPPSPTPIASVSITAPQPNAQVSGTATITASVKNASAAASVLFKVDNVSVGSPVPVVNETASTPWNSESASNGAHMLSASLSDGTVSAAIMVMVANDPIPPVPPTCGFVGPATVTVNPGTTKTFTFTKSGSPDPTVDFEIIHGEIVSVSGNEVFYRAPTPQDDIVDILGCHAHNGTLPDGFNSVTINVPAPPPGAPKITGISPQIGYLRGQGILSFSLFGQNFAVGQSVSVSHGQFLSGLVVSPTRIDFLWTGTVSFFDPGEVEVTLSDPKGSSTTHFVFKGSTDTMACSTTECFQVATIPGVIAIYDRNTGEYERDVWGSFGGRVNIAWDNESGDLAVIGLPLTSISTHDPRFTGAGFQHRAIPEPQSAVSITAISARDGYGCSVRDQEGKFAFFDMRVDGSTPLITSPLIGGQPTPGAMGTLGSQLVCATFGVEDLQYTVLRVPQNTILGQGTLQGLRKASELDSAVGEGGWRLKIFSSGPAAGIAALLHDEDKVVVFLNASTGSELRRVNLTGFPFRMEADEATGTVIIANWDDNERKTRFDKVNASTGQTSSLSGTVNFAATGMEVCGSSVCVANRDNAFAKVPIN